MLISDPKAMSKADAGTARRIELFTRALAVDFLKHAKPFVGWIDIVIYAFGDKGN
jgi:hypothetical protein